MPIPVLSESVNPRPLRRTGSPGDDPPPVRGLEGDETERRLKEGLRISETEKKKKYKEFPLVHQSQKRDEPMEREKMCEMCDRLGVRMWKARG